MSDRFLRLISDDLVTYDFNEYFRIVSMPITYNRSFEHVPDNAGGVDIADGTPKERIISIEGILKADDYTALHAQERLLKKALNKGGKLYIYPDKLDMFLEVKIQDVDESIPEEDPLAIIYSIVFVAEIPFWQSEEEFIISKSCTGETTFDVDFSDSDYFCFPRVTILNFPIFTSTSVVVKNNSDDDKSFTYSNASFAGGEYLVVDGNEGIVTLEDVDDFSHMVTPWQYIRLLNKINSITCTPSNACLISFKYRKLYL